MKAYTMEHVGIAADDTEALAAWYVRVLGFREFFRTESVPPVIFLRDGSGAEFEIFARKSGDAKPAFADRTGMHIAIAVDDFDAAVADLEASWQTSRIVRRNGVRTLTVRRWTVYRKIAAL